MLLIYLPPVIGTKLIRELSPKMINRKESLKRGFTLIELLIVIAILAILGSAVVVVLNPAEILAQTRDGTRVSDLSTLSRAINNYLVQTTQSPPDLGLCTAGGRTTAGTAGVTNSPFGTSGTTKVAVVSTTTTVASAGWIDINFTTTTGGSPIAALPLDPVNSTTYFYGYMCNETGGYTFELTSRLESLKQRAKMVNDGGDRSTCSTYTEDTCWFEMGTDPGLDL